MMSWRDLLARLTQRTTQAAVFYECRQCGTTLSSTTTTCPTCGSEEIAEYDL